MTMTTLRRSCHNDGCDGELTGKANQKYCSDRCRNASKARARRRRLSRTAAEASRQSPEILDAILAHDGLMEELHAGKVTSAEVAKIVGSDHTDSVTRAHRMWERRVQLESVAKGWSPSADTLDLLAGELDEMIREAIADDDYDTARLLCEEAADRFLAFEAEFFRTKIRGRRAPYLRRPFHRRWIVATLWAIFTGGRLMILSPPRHGKSELLVHFCVWLIARNPNITILWVSTNIPTAKTMLRSVKAHLEGNAKLLDAVLPPGQTYKPPTRSNAEWRDDRFRIQQQDHTSVKSPTMSALGRGSKILSMDADLIVADDIEDFESTDQPATRAATRRWYVTQLQSREEEHTAMVFIGSRQHADDLYGHLLGDEELEHIVDQAHDPDCPLDPNDVAAHVDCMLFPELRSYSWLRKKKVSAEALAEPALYEMVYLNQARPEGETIFTEAEVKSCFNPERRIGTDGWPRGVDGRSTRPNDLRLVSGLDPSATKYQAAFTWAWSDERRKLYMIDLDNRLGGGIEPAFDLIRHWHGTYGVPHWVIEENGFQRAIRLDPRIRDWTRDHGVYLEGHQTQSNKNDPRYGVTAMVRLFREGIIDIPYADTFAQEKAHLFLRQLLNFADTGTGISARGATDVPMAAWFPLKVVNRWMKEFEAAADVTYDPVFSTFNGMSAEGLER